MALMKRKLTNLLKAEAEKHSVSLDFYLRDISINGVKKGCSGHVVNVDTGSCVYLTTEEMTYSPLSGKAMYRLAKDTHDYSSNALKNGHNRWCEMTNIASSVVCLLKAEKGDVR